VNVVVGASSDVGLVREANEDSYLIERPLFAVADGMGGHVAGDVASSTAVRVISEKAAAASASNPESLAQILVDANAVIYEKANSDSALRGMGTTCTLVLVDETRAHIAHVGDSRAYLLKDGHLEQLTEDHTLVSRMVREGKISADEAQQHPQRSIITRALGVDSEVQVDLLNIDLDVGDRLLICSDGLSSLVGDETIQEALQETLDPQDAAETLVTLAKEAGGDDNITVLILEFRDDNEPAPAPTTSRSDTQPREQTQPSQQQAVVVTRRRTARGLATLAVIALLAVAAYIATRWALDNSFYIGASASGLVTIYRGIPEEIAGLDLASVERETSLSLNELPPARRGPIKEGMKVESLDQAENTIFNLEDLAQKFKDQTSKDGRA
jgi:serine/threonine protein phosphatase PrpC